MSRSFVYCIHILVKYKFLNYCFILILFFFYYNLFHYICCWICFTVWLRWRIIKIHIDYYIFVILFTFLFFLYTFFLGGIFVNLFGYIYAIYIYIYIYCIYMYEYVYAVNKMLNYLTQTLFVAKLIKFTKDLCNFPCVHFVGCYFLFWPCCEMGFMHKKWFSTANYLQLHIFAY